VLARAQLKRPCITINISFATMCPGKMHKRGEGVGIACDRG
jgi:hypothetical protein